MKGKLVGRISREEFRTKIYKQAFNRAIALFIVLSFVTLITAIINTSIINEKYGDNDLIFEEESSNPIGNIML